MSEDIKLSPREVECLTLLANGLRPDRIAKRLCVSNKSVEKYIASARVKLGAKTRDHAVAIAIKLGLIAPQTEVDHLKFNNPPVGKI